MSTTQSWKDWFSEQRTNASNSSAGRAASDLFTSNSLWAKVVFLILVVIVFILVFTFKFLVCYMCDNFIITLKPMPTEPIQKMLNPYIRLGAREDTPKTKFS